VYLRYHKKYTHLLLSNNIATDATAAASNTNNKKICVLKW